MNEGSYIRVFAVCAKLAVGEVFLLIDVWTNEKIQHQLDSCPKKSIFEKMARDSKKFF